MRSRAFIGETLLRRYLAGDQHALKEEMALMCKPAEVIVLNLNES